MRPTLSASRALAAALALSLPGCAVHPRMIPNASVEDGSEVLAGKTVRYRDASGTHTFVVDSVEYPLMRGTHGDVATEPLAGFPDPEVVTVDLRHVDYLEVLETTGELHTAGKIALGIVEGVMRGLVLVGFMLLVAL